MHCLIHFGDIMNLFYLFIVAIIVPNMAYLLFLVFMGIRSKKWKSTDGRLIKFIVKSARFYSIKIEYEYTVDNTTYIGNRISYLNPSFSTANELESNTTCNKAKSGFFDVYYCENNPKCSVLKTGYIGWPVTIFIILSFLLSISMLISKLL